MAVVFNLPLWVKIIFPWIFLIEWIRRFVHFHFICHDCGGYHEACSALYEPFLGEARRYLTETASQPVVVEFGCGPYPALAAYPQGTHLICIDPCADFDREFNEKWSNSHLGKTGKLTIYRLKLEDVTADIIPDNTADMVFSRCTNCSLSDLPASFRNLNRILKPKGRYYFWDHVYADEPGEWAMRLLQFAWSFPIVSFFTDCSLVRQPWKQLKAAGFTDVKVRRFRTPLTGFSGWPCSPTACGYAQK